MHQFITKQNVDICFVLTLNSTTHSDEALDTSLLYIMRIAYCRSVRLILFYA